jgi:UDP-galactopyranose mutase
MPVGGYTQIFENLLKNVEVRLNQDYFSDRDYFDSLAHKVIFTGPIDRFFNYEFGKLEYRSLRWETKKLEIDSFQGVPVVNYTDHITSYTRILEHKWFDFQNQKNTIVSYEFPADYDGLNEPYYPVRDEQNTKIFSKYEEMSKNQDKFIFGGRLAGYVYYDMHQIIAQALKKSQEILYLS